MNAERNSFDEHGLSQREDVLAETLPVVVTMCMLLALLLRLFQLGHQSLWVDELLTIEQGRMVGHSLWEQFLDDFQSPLPMLIVSGLARLSFSEAWLRLPGALLGVLSIPVFLDVARHFLNRRGAVLATMLFALHPMHIAHSQEVRGYAYLLFFGLAATSVGLNGAAGWNARRWMAIVILGVAATLSNLQGLFWMAGLGLGLLVAGRVRREDLVTQLTAFVAIAIVTSPWWLRSLGVIELGRVVPGETLGVPLRGASTFSVWSLPYAGFVLSFGRSLGPTTAELHALFAGDGFQPSSLGWAQLVLAAVAAMVVGVTAWIGLRRLGVRRSVELVTWVFVVVVVAVLLSVRNVKPFNPRYIIAALPVLLIIVGAGLQSLPRAASLVVFSLWLGLTGISLSRYYFDSDYGNADVRAAAQLVQERGSAEDAILVPTVDRVFKYYYRGQASVASAYEKDFVDDASAAARVAEIDPTARYLWYVEARPWFADPQGRFPRVLSRSYRQLSEFRLPGVRLLLFDRQSEPLAGH